MDFDTEDRAGGHGHKHDHDHGHGHDHAHSHVEPGGSRQAALLALGIALFIAGLITEHIFSGSHAIYLYVAAYATVAWDVIRQMKKDLSAGLPFTENSLMTVASIGAFLIGEHAEGAAVMVFYTLGEVLQSLAVRKSRASIAAAMDLRPDKARVIRDGLELELSPEAVETGEMVSVRPGEKVPLDGTVLEGHSFLDTSKLTGEFVPKRAEKGSEVMAGAINGTGLLIIKVGKPYGLSTAARIMKTVEEAEDKKAQPERFIRRFARYYTPVVFALAVTLALLPPALGYGTLADWTRRALVMLVMACPCALIISVPLAYFAGLGRISRLGVLVKGAAFVDVLARLDTVVFDKTGTLTEGSFKVRHVAPAEGVTGDELVSKAASAEAGSLHPIASSIVQYAKDQGIVHDSAGAEGYREMPGRGVIASVDGREVAVGNRVLMDEIGAVYEDGGCNDPSCAHTVAGVAIDGSMIGSLHLGDSPKEMASDTVAALRALGISRIAMLSGDKPEAAKAIAAAIGVHEVHAGLMPDEKLRVLEEIIAKGGKTAFVGDGVNDAPALARADIGIAMGVLGSDAAIETADLVVMDDNLGKLPGAIKAARYTRTVAMQNIAAALLVKAIFLTMGGFGKAGMVEALVADVGLTLLTVLNSFRLFKGSAMAPAVKA